LETLHVLEAVEVPVERSDCDTLVGRDRRHPGVGKVDRLGLEPLQRVQHDRFRRHLETTTSDEVTKGVRHLGPVLLVEAGEDERGLGDDCGVEVQLDLSRGAQEDRGDGGVFPSGFSNSFGIPGLGSVGLDLRSLGSSDKGMLSRCTRGKVLIASNSPPRFDPAAAGVGRRHDRSADHRAIHGNAPRNSGGPELDKGNLPKTPRDQQPELLRVVRVERLLVR